MIVCEVDFYEILGFVCNEEDDDYDEEGDYDEEVGYDDEEEGYEEEGYDEEEEENFFGVVLNMDFEI